MPMIVDGKAIATSIYSEIHNLLSDSKVHPHLTVFTCAPNFETTKYLNLKRRKAIELGIEINVIEFLSSVTTEAIVGSIKKAALHTDGIIIQLPFPMHLDIEIILATIPSHLDVDAVSYHGQETAVLPPVVGAIKEISNRYNVAWYQVPTAIVGQGNLVGKPAALWARAVGAQVEIITKETPEPRSILQNAKIIISGTGVPGLITPEDISQGVIIFDAGTSEDSGELRGDVSVDCAEKASLFTPVPGGIGPITVAVLLRNLAFLTIAALSQDTV